MVWMPKFLKAVIFSHKPFDRRKYPRTSPFKEIECSLIYEEMGQKKEIPLYVMNVSRVGMLVSTDEVKIYPATPAQIKFKPASRPEPVLIAAHIVRTYRRKKLRYYYSGLEFNDSEDKNVASLLDLISKAK